MLALASLFLALQAMATTQQSTGEWSGREARTRVPIPRIAAAATVDGVLGEDVWARASRLTGFSQYQPVDGRPADEPTEILVWYAPDALWFGVRARELHGDVVRATRANRDNISSEDHVQILLDTYNDRRNTFVFGVNALGVQQDGTRSDQFGGGAGGRSAMGGGMRDMNPLDGNVDLNPDFVFESKGRVTENGYEVEIRIPFKSLRFQDAPVQDWGIHILRRVQHSGAQDTWAPALRASASFLGQAGVLEGIREVQRGLGLDFTPTVTARSDGSRASDGDWRYRGEQAFGADVRWGARQDLTLNGTVNPDFSQVEADVGQVTLNERFALFYPEKRPFFLDGLELFDTPNQLIYTRRIVAPDAGVKLAGQSFGTNVAALIAADEKDYGWSRTDRPVYLATRLKRSLTPSSTLGGVMTAREEGGDYSRLTGLDARVYHSRLYYVQGQAVRSWSDSAGQARTGSLIEAEWDRTGRAWGFHYRARGVAPDFRADAGFVNRSGIAEGSAYNRLSYYGAPGALIQTAGAFIGFLRTRTYDDPWGASLEGSESVSPSATLRGGWRLNSSFSRSFFAYEAPRYAGYTVLRGGTAQPFVVPSPETDLFAASVGATTPTFRKFTATLTLSRGDTPLFREAAPGRSTRVDATVDLRPTSALRTTLQFTRLALTRTRDGSEYSREVIPRLKTEYQLTPAMFVRVVAQYASRSREALVTRDGERILIGGVADNGESSNDIQMDWLFSYRPSPGTLLYFGYGSTLADADAYAYAFRDVRRTRDGFFVKGSYVIRP